MLLFQEKWRTPSYQQSGLKRTEDYPGHLVGHVVMKSPVSISIKANIGKVSY